MLQKPHEIDPKSNNFKETFQNHYFENSPNLTIDGNDAQNS
jgi:hypothetical protein